MNLIVLGKAPRDDRFHAAMTPEFVMPGPWSRASTSLLTCRKKDVDGRDKSPAMTTQCINQDPQLFGRLSITRLALPIDRSSVSGATILTCVLMPMVFLMYVVTLSA
jgi:hypothetical protein